MRPRNNDRNSFTFSEDVFGALPASAGGGGEGEVFVAEAEANSRRRDSILARVSSRVRSSSFNLACSRASSSRMLSAVCFMVQTVFSHRKAVAANHSECRV